MPAPLIAMAGTGLARWGLSTIYKSRNFELFKQLYSKASQHPLGFGILYAGGTTLGYHSNPFNWRQNYKYVGRPQYVNRL